MPSFLYPSLRLDLLQQPSLLSLPPVLLNSFILKATTEYLKHLSENITPGFLQSSPWLQHAPKCNP